MAVSFLAPALLAGAAAAAVFLAPSAGADAPAGPGSARDGSSDASTPAATRAPSAKGYSPKLPTGWLNEAQFAKPGTNPFGAGQMPSILALTDE